MPNLHSNSGQAVLSHSHNNTALASVTVSAGNAITKTLTETITISDQADRLLALIKTRTESAIQVSGQPGFSVNKAPPRDIERTFIETINVSTLLVKISSKKRSSNEAGIVVSEGRLVKELVIGESAILYFDSVHCDVTRQSPTNPEKTINENILQSGLLTRHCGKWRKVGGSS